MPVAPVPVNLPPILAQSGAQPTDPATIRALLVALVSATNPGFTADLPGSLIEDITSTDTLAAILSDQARVELINSLTPFGANEFLLNQLGQQFGIMLGEPTNTSVNVVITITANAVAQQGFNIPPGFAVSDGQQIYVVLSPGGVTGALGTTQPLTAVSVNPGSFPVPANTVNIVNTTVPLPFVATCNNPVDGTPGQLTPESWSSYRTRVLTAQQAPSTAMISKIRTELWAVPGVLQRSVSIQTPSTGGVLVLASGGDEYQMAFAAWRSCGDPTNLVPSVNVATGITNAVNGVVTTFLKHGLTTGTVTTLADSNPSNFNGTYTITVVDDYTFDLNHDTSGFPTYVSDSAVVTPNPRNVITTIQDPPDQYQIPIANPLQQTVTGSITWNTDLPNFSQVGAVNQAIAPAVVGYVNSLATGQFINGFEIIEAIQQATINILPNQNLTRIVISISIDGAGVSPTAGTQIYPSDSQSILVAADNAFVIAQG